MLRINGVLDIPVLEGGITLVPEYIGGTVERAYDGGAFSQARAIKRAWRIETALLTEAERAAVVSAIGIHAVVTAAFTFDGAVAVNAMITEEQTSRFTMAGAGVLRAMTLLVLEQ